MCLIWLAHTDYDVRRKALEILEVISSEQIRTLTNGKVIQEAPFLLDGALKLSEDKVENTWYEPLTDLLVNHSDVSRHIYFLITIVL